MYKAYVEEQCCRIEAIFGRSKVICALPMCFEQGSIEPDGGSLPSGNPDAAAGFEARKEGLSVNFTKLETVYDVMLNHLENVHKTLHVDLIDQVYRHSVETCSFCDKIAMSRSGQR